MLAALSDQGYVFGADDPGFDLIAPRDLHVFTVGLQSLEYLNLITFVKSLQRSTKDVVLLHVMLHRHPIIVEALLRADEFVPQIEELLETFAGEHKFRWRLTLFVDPKDCIAASNVLDQQGEQGIDLIFNWSDHVQLQVDHVSVR